MKTPEDTTLKLPEPDEEGRFIVGRRAIWIDSRGVPCIELIGLDDRAVTDGAAIPIGDANEACEIAYALLSADRYSKE